MKNFKLLLLVLFSVAIYSTILAQPINNQIKDVVMPPPSASSLGKYSDIPVGYATGVPNISIPIHSMKEGAIGLPISLSYHASGVKVAEVASWAGLGWSLQAGGMISRTTQGRPDESTSGYFTIGNQMAVNAQNQIVLGTAGISAQSLSSGNMDGEPDIFNFSFAGNSGKFFWDSDGTAITIPK